MTREGVAAIKREPVVRLRFCAHPCCHRLVKGRKGALCVYHGGTDATS